jgi:ubiquitin-conjugating enzyme E2 J1
MITDAKGQLGGYDTTEAVRRRLAGESHAFRCATCGRSNAEIIRECEERAREACTSPSDEVQVPEELNLGFRDELEARKAQAEQQKRERERQEEAAEVAQLAEGFVQTVPVPAAAAPTPTSPLSPVAVGGAGQRQAAQLGPAAAVPQAGAISTNSPRRPSDEGVPVWLDRLIVALVVMLSALVLKVLFGV